MTGNKVIKRERDVEESPFMHEWVPQRPFECIPINPRYSAELWRAHMRELFTLGTPQLIAEDSARLYHTDRGLVGVPIHKFSISEIRFHAKLGTVRQEFDALEASIANNSVDIKLPTTYIDNVAHCILACSGPIITFEMSNGDINYIADLTADALHRRSLRLVCRRCVGGLAFIAVGPSESAESKFDQLTKLVDSAADRTRMTVPGAYEYARRVIDAAINAGATFGTWENRVVVQHHLKLPEVVCITLCIRRILRGRKVNVSYTHGREIEFTLTFSQGLAYSDDELNWDSSLALDAMTV